MQVLERFFHFAEQRITVRTERTQCTARVPTQGGFLDLVLVFFLVELFGATSTLWGVARRAGLLNEHKMWIAAAVFPFMFIYVRGG